MVHHLDMGKRTTEARTVAKPIKWTQDEWDALERHAKNSGISPTNLPRVLTLAAIGYGPMAELVKNAREAAQRSLKPAMMRRKPRKTKR